MTDTPPPFALAPFAPALAPSERLVITTSAEDAGERLDKALARHVAAHAELSRTRLQTLARQGFILVDGKPASDPKLKLREGQLIEISLPEAVAPTPRGEAIELDVVYEDDQLIIIDKPVGLVVHPAAGHETGTLVNALIAHCGESLSGIGGVKRPGIVHRLDKDTSGLMVAAKTDRAHKHLAQQFADHGREGPLERAYLAFVWGDVPGSLRTIDAPLDRDPRNREKMAVVSTRRKVGETKEEHAETLERGRFAITHLETLERYPPAKPLASLVRCELETGRTHQIRVHMAHAGHPLIGDMNYGAGFRTKLTLLPDAAQSAIIALGRQALHAAVLGFEHPVTGEHLSFERDWPADMELLHQALSGL
ncbi:MAG: RluA family pseudouridine synthase [Bosea sp. (in: a-proteobacteria)]